jgi:hypothetical protein
MMKKWHLAVFAILIVATAVVLTLLAANGYILPFGR